jgi:hypothetical protein
VDEYKQLAAILCFDIDTLVEVFSDDLTAEQMREQVRDFQQQKNELISSRELRESRARAISLLFGTTLVIKERQSD